jgi:hypothetical protein
MAANKKRPGNTEKKLITKGQSSSTKSRHSRTTAKYIDKNKTRNRPKFTQEQGASSPAKHGEKTSAGFGGDSSGGYNKNYDKRGVSGKSHGKANSRARLKARKK